MSWSYFMLIASEEQKALEIVTFGRNRISAEKSLSWSLQSQLFHFCLLGFVCLGMLETKCSQIGTTVNFLDESKRCLRSVKSVRHFGKCHANHVNRARVFIG